MFLKFICDGFLEKRMPDEGFWIYVFCMENRVFESFSARSFWCFAADAHGFFRGFGGLNPSIIGVEGVFFCGCFFCGFFVILSDIFPFRDGRCRTWC